MKAAAASDVASDVAPRRLAVGEPAVAGLSRLLLAEVRAAEGALGALSSEGDTGIIHAVRKRLKKARTITRLLRPALGSAARALNEDLRDAARALAGARDAVVLAETAEALARRLDEPAEKALLADVAAAARARAAVSQTTPDVVRARQRLAAATTRLARARPVAADDAAVAELAVSVYRQARRGWRAAERSPDTETLHDWRKRVKDRLHLVHLFSARWPEPGARRAQKLDRLGEWLGDEHDLALLAEALPREDTRTPRLRRLIAERRRRLAAKACALADDLFAEKPRKVRAAWVARV